MVQDGRYVFLEYKFKNEIRSKYTDRQCETAAATSTIEERSNVV